MTGPIKTLLESPCSSLQGLPMYEHLNVHGCWLMRDTRVSRSLGNIVNPVRMTELFGSDAFRCFLLREMHFGADASFNYDALIARVNMDPANDPGSLFSRVLSMTARYENSVVPQPGDKTEEECAIIAGCQGALSNCLSLFSGIQFAKALEAMWELVKMLSKYAGTQAPWVLAREGREERLKTVPYVLFACMRRIAILLWPVMPKASETMLQQLGQNTDRGVCPDMSVDKGNTLFCRALSWHCHLFLLQHLLPPASSPASTSGK